MEELYKEAMEALRISEYLAAREESDDLLCECNPVSYREVSNFIISNKNNSLNCTDVMRALRIAQGCGTCLNAASEFIELKLENLNQLKGDS